MEGKKGVTLSLNTLGIAFLTIAVVTVIAMIFNQNAGGLAEGPFKELIKLLPVGEPKIVGFRVEQIYQNSDEFSVSFELAGNLRGLDKVEVLKKYSYYGDIYETPLDGMGGKVGGRNLLGPLKDMEWKFEIPDQNIGSQKVLPGYTKYSVIVKTKGGDEFSDSVLIKAYDENYLERHDRSVEFCDSQTDALLRADKTFTYDNKKCDVIECKKNELSSENNLDGGKTYYEISTIGPCSEAADMAIRAVAAGKSPSQCGGYLNDKNEDQYNPGMGKLGFEFRTVRLNSNGCSNEQVDELSKKMVWVNFVRTLCEISSLEQTTDWMRDQVRDNGLDWDYSFLSYADYTKAVDSAVGKTNSCVYPYRYDILDNRPGGASRGVDGAKYYFDNAGFIEIDDGLEVRKKAVRDELSSLIRPGVGEVNIKFNGNINENENFGATFFPIGSKNVNKMSIKYCWSKYAIDDEFTEDPGKECEEDTVGNPTEDIVLHHNFLRGFTEIKPGMYTATVTVDGKTSSDKGGIFSDEYLETYKGVNAYYDKQDKTEDNKRLLTVCVERPDVTSGSDQCEGGEGDVGPRHLAECGDACDVIGKKAEAFRTPNQNTDDVKTSIPYNYYWEWKGEDQNTESDCTLLSVNPGTWFADDYYRLNGSSCTPQEIYELYEGLFRERYLFMIEDLMDQGEIKREDYEEWKADALAGKVDFHCNDIFNKYDPSKDYRDDLGIDDGDVCETKDKLRKKLRDGLGWTYIT